MPCTDSNVLFLLFAITNMAAKVGELEDSIQEVYQHSKDNRKEMGRLEGIRVTLIPTRHRINTNLAQGLLFNTSNSLQ